MQLIDAHDDNHLWANNYDRELVDVFATQSAVAREISNSLHLEIQPDTVDTLQGMPTRSVRAYDLYIKAKSIDRSEAESESSLTRRRELLEAAVVQDPDFVEAWALLNEILDDSIRNILQNGWFVPQGEDPETISEALQIKALRALNKAIALDPENIETLLARASDFVAETSADFRAERRKVIDHAIDKYPDNAMAWYVLGWWYNLDGDLASANPAFLKALQLDPLNARIVEGSLTHFRLNGEQELTTMLFERLRQLVPEKGEEKHLGRALIMGKLEAILNAFYATADEALLDTYADEIAKNHSFPSEITQATYRIYLLELQNNLDKLLNEQGDLSLAQHININDLQGYLWLNLRLLQAQQITGHAANARVTAIRLTEVASQKVKQQQHINDETINMMLAIAYGALGERDKAQKSVDKLLGGRSKIYNAYGWMGFIALAAVDIDSAVTLILAEKTQHPSWKGTDILAANHILFRHIIVNPRMQAYLVNEGKWSDYLTARVPEYNLDK
ncbi:MAG: tetratricopeptide (TPR) repeat protein [Paraglaciecola sp.]